LAADVVEVALFVGFESFLQFSAEISLPAQAVAVADGEFGFLAIEDEGGEGFQVLGGDFGCWGERVADLVVGC
jgi:hypothetical protein